MATPTLQTYTDCVASLRTSLSFLESSVQTLDSGVADYPRLVSVLKTVRHYELIPQATLAEAESSLRSEIGPFVAHLLDRADGHLERQARRIETLKAKAELQAGRLSQGPEGFENGGGGSSSYGKSRKAARTTSATSGLGGKSKKQLTGQAALRAQMVHQKREALKYAVDRLEMEVVQKERELRLRLGE